MSIAVNLSKVIPTIGSPKNINTICNIRGVPRITHIYNSVILDISFIFDNLPMETRIPKGMESIRVKKNTSKVVIKPSIIAGNKVYIYPNIISSF